MHQTFTLSPYALSGLERTLGFNTIDGVFVSLEEGEAAIRSGQAMLVGGLLVGLFAFSQS